MEEMCQIGQTNSKLQGDISCLEATIERIKAVNTENICWSDSVVFDCVVAYLSEEVELKKFQKEFNKKAMTNILVKHIKQ